MNYTLSCIDRSKRWLQVECRTTLQVDYPCVRFNLENSIFTSRLVRMIVHDKQNRELPLIRLSAGVWQINAPKNTTICVTYVLHAFVMSPLETYVSGETWIINPISCCIDIQGSESLPCSITLTASGTFVSSAEIREDIEGKVVEFENYKHMIHYTILGGEHIENKGNGLYYKGNLKPEDVSALETYAVEKLTNVLVFGVPKEIETRALEYGKFETTKSIFLIVPFNATSPMNDFLNKIRDSIIFNIMESDLEWNSYRKYHPSTETQFIIEGWNEYQQIIAVRDTDSEKYRKLLERYYIRSFSMSHYPEETLLDSCRAQVSTRGRDFGVVIWHQLELIKRHYKVDISDDQWSSFDWTTIQTVNEWKEHIKHCLTDSLEWFWCLCLDSKDLSGFLTVCCHYIKQEGFLLEQPRRGPLRLI